MTQRIARNIAHLHNTHPKVSCKSINNAIKTNKELTFYFFNTASPSSLVLPEMLSQ